MPTARKKVLFIENDLIYSQFALGLFHELEPTLDVFHVNNGAMAWSVLSKGYRPDVIVSDLRVPKMDGPTLLVKVRGATELRDIPFVMLSESSAKGPAAPEHSGPADHQLSKPYSSEQFASLMEKVKSLCDQAPHSISAAAAVTV